MMAAPSDCSKTVLVVDDDGDLRGVAAIALGLEGYAVWEATNGLEALRILRSGSVPCVVLLDLRMPVMNGWEFLEERRGDSVLSKIPVVALSAGYLGEGPIDGVVAFMPKPVDLEDLLRTVRTYCS